MSSKVSQVSALALVVCFFLSQPAVIAASTLSLTSTSSQPKSIDLNPSNSNGRTALLTVVSERPSTEGSKGKSQAVSAQRTTRKASLRFKARNATSEKAYLKSGKRFRNLAHHRATFGNQEDCDACHNQCLLTSAACIAISIIAACPACGVVCLVHQAACQSLCNTTTACKNLSLPVVNDN